MNYDVSDKETSKYKSEMVDSYLRVALSSMMT